MEERAADPLAGGILQRGHQCGMLWGASLAIGAESYHRHGHDPQAFATAITTTKTVERSFVRQTQSPNCRDITNCDFKSKLSMAKYFFTGRFLDCFNLAESWAPDAVSAAQAELPENGTGWKHRPISCASEVVRKMGGSDLEVVMVAGFAGGLGLTGNACGALGAAVWMKQLKWLTKQAEEKPDTVAMLKAFYGATHSKVKCRNICGRSFCSVDDHSQYIRRGGCRHLLDTLAEV